jgi:RNA polymerase sigma-70 factor (ECF subfamily)
MDQKAFHDEWLMAEAARGDRDCLASLVRRYANRLLTFIRRMVEDPHKSEELFQEVFLTVWKKRRQYQYPRPFKPWLYAIAANHCHGAFRTRTLPAAQVEEEAGPLSPEPGPVETAIATETAALVAAAVRRLPAHQRAVVVLRVWEGMSYAEIAAVVGRTESTVRSHMHHGLASMRRYLEPRLRPGT